MCKETNELVKKILVLCEGKRRDTISDALIEVNLELARSCVYVPSCNIIQQQEVSQEDV